MTSVALALCCRRQSGGHDDGLRLSAASAAVRPPAQATDSAARLLRQYAAHRLSDVSGDDNHHWSVFGSPIMALTVIETRV